MFLVFLLIFFFSSNAYAYVDPGSGSYFIQLISGAILGLILFIKMGWRHILAWFTKIFK